ncbi:MAG: 50S ribosomal protein L18 [Chitinophagales bacterium]
MGLNKLQRKSRIKNSIRAKVSGTAERPRLSVFRSNKSIYVQLIDDISAHTIAAASSNEADVSGTNKTEKAKSVGSLIAKKAIDKGIESVVFDRNGKKYHGRVKALADGARETGLKF